METTPDHALDSEKALKLQFEEVTQGHSKYDEAIAVHAAPEESQEAVEARLTETLTRDRWYLQDKWRSKKIREQISIHIDGISLEIFNFSKELEAHQLEEMQNALRDYVSLKDNNVFQEVHSVVIDNEQPLNPHTGNPMNGWGGKDGAIKLFPVAFAGVPHRVADVSNLEGAVIHELSHSLGTDFENAWRKEFEWKSLDTPKALPGGSFQYEEVLEPNRCVTEYARVSAAEDVCDSMVAALRNPEALDAERLKKIKTELLPSTPREVTTTITKKNVHDYALPKIVEPILYKRVPKSRIVIKSTSTPLTE